MVVYNLACHNAHRFEGWFASPEAFDGQVKNESVSCPVCGSNGVVREPSAPNIAKSVSASQKADITGEAIRELQARILDHVMRNTEDVGKSFPEEARRIHHQEAPERPIRGEATPRQAKELREEGIDVVALPAAVPPPKQLH